MTFDFTAIVQALFALFAAIITYVAIPFIKSKTTAAQQKQINTWVRIAVAAAQQLYDGSSSEANSKKKKYVLGLLHEYGIELTEEQVDALIESAVYEMKNGILTIGEIDTATAEILKEE